MNNTDINIQSSNKSNDNNPLVSIIVITYNSSKYVLETLESVKTQIYQNIELIVSDDCSQDNTVEICKNWIDENKECFVRTKITTVDENTGIPANCNRGVSNAKGKWVKLIAGDDVLLSNCVIDNMEFIQNNPEAFFVVSISEEFGENQYSSNKPKKTNPLFFCSAEKQFKYLLISNWIMAPSVFMNKNAFIKVGGFDESIRTIEDYPLYLRATSAGYRFFYFDKPTVKYRKHENAISNNQKFNRKMIEGRIDILYKYQLPNITFGNALYYWNTFLELKYCHRKTNLMMFLSPLYILSRIKLIFYKS